MNIFKRQIAFYPKGVPLYTAIIALHVSRISIFSSHQTLGAETVSTSVLLMLVCIAANFFVVFRERANLTHCVSPTVFFLLYVLYGMMTLAWSPVPKAYMVLPKCLEVLSSYLMVSVVLWKIKDKYMCLSYLLLLCTMIAVMGYVPLLIRYRMIWQHSSFFPMAAAMGTLIALGMRKIYKDPDLKYYLWVNLAIMVLGTSSTTYIAFICGYFIYNSSSRWGVNILRSIAVMAVFLFLWWMFKEYITGFVFMGKSESAIETFTGRDYIWEKSMAAWRLNPFFGVGFIAAERNLSLLTDIVSSYVSTHNGYISILLGTGIMGAFIMGVFLLKTIFEVLTSTFKFSIGREMTVLLPALAVLIVNNMSVHAIGAAWDISMPAVLVLVSLINTLKYKKNIVY